MVLLDPLQERRIDDGAVFQAVAMVLSGKDGKRLFESVQGHFDGPIPVGMDADLIPRLVSPANHLVKRFLGFDRQNSAVFRSHIRFGKISGSSGDAAVGQNLDPAETQPLVTESGFQFEGLELGKIFDGNQHVHANLQVPALEGLLIGFDGLGRSQGVVDAGQPGRDVPIAGETNPFDPFFQRKWRHDRRLPGGSLIDKSKFRLLVKNSVQPAGLRVSPVGSSFGIGGIFLDSPVFRAREFTTAQCPLTC